MPDRDYDPELDITAAEIRAAGGRLSESIPDCAWVPRGSMRMGEANVTFLDGRQLRASFDVTFDQPFRWVEVKGTLQG